MRAAQAQPKTQPKAQPATQTPLRPNDISEQRKLQLASYQAVLQLIDAYYLEERNVAGLLDSVINAVLSRLDPHSYYQTPDATSSATAYYKGEGYRYGFAYDFYHGRPVIQRVTPGSPASDAGLLPGDNVDVIWGQPVETLKEAEADAMFLSGPTLEMIVTRNGGRKRVHAKLELRQVHDRSVEIAEMLDKITAYIYLSGFIASTYYEMKRALEDLTAAGMKKLILDLRGNGGGLFDEGKFVASLFLPFHTKLVGTRGRGDTSVLFDSTYVPGRFTDVELVILVDEGTASAAEIVAGVLQDHDRALVIGEQTFGKGLLQRRFDLPDGGSFALTMGHYYLPSGRCIQRKYVGNEFVEQRKPLPLGNNRGHVKDTLLPYDGRFVTSANRTVYGGQGIVPEIIVINDTAHAVIVELWEQQAFDRFTDTILNLNAEKLAPQYKDAADFVKRYQAKAEMLPLFTKIARQQGVKDAGTKIESHRAEVLHELKRWLCYRLFPNNGWERSALAQDKQFDEAVKLLKEQLVVK
jgi:carboxyl-terminal processing protease